MNVVIEYAQYTVHGLLTLMINIRIDSELLIYSLLTTHTRQGQRERKNEDERLMEGRNEMKQRSRINNVLNIVFAEY